MCQYVHIYVCDGVFRRLCDYVCSMHKVLHRCVCEVFMYVKFFYVPKFVLMCVKGVDIALVKWL